MVTLVALIAPQRSTQYAALANTLAPYELALSQLRHRLRDVSPLQLGGQAYLKIELEDALSEQDIAELSMFATQHAFFTYYDRIGAVEGPFLQPIDTHVETFVPQDIVVTRRYKGKTNELLTQFMCNVARASSAYATTPWNELRVFDPLAGGGTTLFTALVLGAEAAGVEKSSADVTTTVTFVKQYLQELRRSYKLKEERLRRLGNRWTFTIEAETPRRLILAQGETADTPGLIQGFKPHLIVTDLPYGVQHQGELQALLSQGLPAWTSTLVKGGTVVFSWDATRFSRDTMVALVESVSPLSVLNDPPYTLLAHRVDRAIKQRDIIVARVRADIAP